VNGRKSFSLLYSYKPNLEQKLVEVAIGGLKIYLNNSGLDFLGSVSLPNSSVVPFDRLFNISLSKMSKIKILNSNNSQSLLFISKHSLDRNVLKNNFIKIGTGYKMTENVFLEINPINEDGNFVNKLYTKPTENFIIMILFSDLIGLNVMKDIKEIRFDHISFTDTSCSHLPVIGDYHPVILDTSKPFPPSKIVDPFVVTPASLPPEGRRLYDKIYNVEIPEWLKYAVSAIEEKRKKNVFGRRNSLYIRAVYSKDIMRS